jgi:alkanesulfonate monooxygenase SsuD/methylene tetrahydromethanopterin reductase-like flavin-dependent oxidoreductase (luciferase family)
MKFGWLTLALSPSPEEDATRIDAQLTQACYAEALGFDDIWLTEHYFTGESVYNDPLIFASALAMRTTRVRIGFAVLQMALHHPVRLAVQLALLDNLSKGRLDVGVGRGTLYNEYEFVGYGLRSDDSRARMDEAVAILTGAWTTAPFTYEGAYYQVRIPELRPRPYQQPYPPLWRSVISPSSFTECGRLGIPLLTTRLSVERLAERWKLYKEGLAEGGHDPETQRRLLEQAAVWRNVYVADSDAQAEDELATLLQHSRTHMTHVRSAYNPEDFQVDPAMLNPWSNPAVSDEDALRYVMESGCIYGTAAHVRDELAALSDAGVQHVLCQTSFGDMAHDKVMTAMRRIGEEVMPSLRGTGVGH